MRFSPRRRGARRGQKGEGSVVGSQADLVFFIPRAFLRPRDRLAVGKLEDCR
jgi:hypothetical protein